jgi:multiple sugar transport system ATP-binding protein
MNFVRNTISGGKINVNGTDIDLSNMLDRQTLDSYEGKGVVFGFRPEGIVLGNQPDSFVFEANVQLTELLGDNTNVYVEMNSSPLILKVDPHDTPEDDTKVTFSVPYANAYLFDGESEIRIEKK